MTAMPLITAMACGGLGVVAGLVHFRLMRHAIRKHVEAHDARGALPLHLARLALAIILFGLAAHLGALPLLATFVGFLVARRLVVRAVHVPT